MPTVMDHLRRAADRDAEKGGGGGLRSTREVAEYTGLSLATARRRLWAAVERGEAEAFDEGASGAMGNPILWALAAPKKEV